MKKFVIVYHAPAPEEQQMQPSPEDMEAVMAAWMAWAERCGDAIVDLGTPLGNGRKVAPDSVDESTREVVGFSIMQAESMEAVTAMLQEHPHLNMPGGCTIDVHESLPLPV